MIVVNFICALGLILISPVKSANELKIIYNSVNV